ncbi:hypothetical protein [Psychrobacter urativorans]|uniref:Uncharacterized protein n=1 Tax=Psychrobacter urativorans TaxID=45610 RepID=A0A0M4T8F6_9GAMM|nr:hypothetical protein [Psychrobacter urativorans]ALF60134.1 hypothetical protein AOC03_08860 [Psychrobacter urativorans]
MNSPLITSFSIPTPSTPTSFFKIAALSLFILSGCQKAPTPDKAETGVQNIPVTSTINQDITANPNQQNIDGATTTDSLANHADAADDANITTNPETMPLSPQQPIKGTQVTDVHYRSDSGETLTVVFKTSAIGVLSAIITLPNQSKMTLSAPAGQGNNPTYQSADGDIELVSHEGGTIIDLIRNNKVTSFEAVSAEAEVITQT